MRSCTRATHTHAGPAASLHDAREASTSYLEAVRSAAAADDTLLVGRNARDDGSLLAALVDYACHPTTLAWQNTLVALSSGRRSWSDVT